MYVSIVRPLHHLILLATLLLCLVPTPPTLANPSPTPPASPLILNEILTRNLSFPNPTTLQTLDWVELLNPSDTPLDLSPYYLTDSLSQPDRWRLPHGTILPPHGMIVIDLDGDYIPTLLSTETRRRLTAPFSLSSAGDALYLFRRIDSNAPLQKVDGIEFGPQVPNFSLARATTHMDWVLSTPTPGTTNVPTTLAPPTQLTINEWMARPTEGEDWVEIHNASALPVSLEGIRLTDSDDRARKPTFGPYSYVGTQNHGFARVWADDSDAPGHVPFKLSSAGETLRLLNAQGSLLNQITFRSQSTDRSEGRMPDGGPSFRTLVAGGTPDLPNAVALEGLQFSEVLSHTDDPLEDAIEIQNLRAESVDLSGWYLSDNPSVPRKYRIPEGTIMEPGGFAVFYRYQFQPRPGIFPSFGFNSAHGDDLYLFHFHEDEPGVMGRISTEFASAPNGYSFGTYLTSLGYHMDLMTAVSLGTSITATNPVHQTPLFRLGRGATNPPPLMTPLAISEIATGMGGNLDYIEILNIVQTNVTFYDLVFPTNTYSIRGSVDFQWPPETEIRPGEAVVVVNFDPKSELGKLNHFRQTYGLGAHVQVMGPYRGTLRSAAGELRLYRPDIPQFCFDPDFGFVAPILVDRVRYSDDCPWPTASRNQSLQRIDFQRLGDDPVHWRVGDPSPGDNRRVLAGVAPEFRRLTHGEALQDKTISFQLEPLSMGQDRSWCIQWRFNGQLLPGENQTTLTLSKLSPEQSGLYTALVRNDAGAVRADFPLRVLAAPILTKPPQSIAVAPGGTGLLSLCARGTPPFEYSWSKDGEVLRDQTNSTLVLTQMNASHTGIYTVRLTTPGGATDSPPVLVTLLTRQSPQVVVQPQGLDFRENSPIRRDTAFSLHVKASGTPPLSYQWTRNGAPIPGANEPSYHITRFSDSDVGEYQVHISNDLGHTSSRTVRLQFLELPAVRIRGNDEIVVNAGDNVPLLTESTGTPRLYYQWTFNGRDIPAELCKDFTRFAIAHGQGGVYEVRCWNKQGEVILGTDYSQKVRVIVRPQITGLFRDEGEDRLDFIATGGERYRVEASADLLNWAPVQTLQTSAGGNRVRLPSDGRAHLFYRLVRE